MDDMSNNWYYPDMNNAPIPSWQLYGEQSPFPDLVHIETITDRAAGLDWHISPHRHLHLHQIFLIQSGDLRLTIDGKTQRASPPLVMNMPRGHVHGFTFSAGTQGFVLTLPADDFPEIFGPNGELSAALDHPFLATPENLGPLFQSVAQLHVSHGPYRRLKLRAAAISLCCAAAERVRAVAGNAAGSSRLAAFEDLIRAHLADAWQLADYAAALAISERHLRRLSLAATGLSAHGFLETTRMREACRLLAYTRMRVQEVGFALGFDDPAYFARVFRRSLGMSASEYRKRLGGD